MLITEVKFVNFVDKTNHCVAANQTSCKRVHKNTSPPLFL